MITDLSNLNGVLAESTEINAGGLQDRNDYPETESRILSNGSSHVLNDFLDFTDYLIPVNRKTRYSITEDYYSALNSL